MGAIYNFESHTHHFDEIFGKIALWPSHLKARLLVLMASDMAINTQKDVPLSVDAVMNFARLAVQAGSSLQATTAEPNGADAERAAALLSLRSGITGPERALISAVRLYHTGKAAANARTINATNDEFRGSYISNITAVVNSNIKEGNLEEVRNDDAKPEGHASFKVTAKGLMAFEAIYQKQQSQLQLANRLSSDEDAA